jgi:hypothetical protein
MLVGTMHRSCKHHHKQTAPATIDDDLQTMIEEYCLTQSMEPSSRVVAVSLAQTLSARQADYFHDP